MPPYEKFQELLKQLFQFETSDLDFGVYRIFNFKRSAIENFINRELRKKVDDSFKKHKTERLDTIKINLEEAKNRVIENLGTNSFTSSGELKNDFKETPAGKEYLIAKMNFNEVEKLEEIQSQVFNDLYNFFSLFYQDGDFVPQYRYSIKNHKYAIPYNGEEIKLYWANKDQYYIKTGILFRDYTFTAGINKELKVIFRISEAEEELGSNKATKERFFILDNENPVDVIDSVYIIRFLYRELTKSEVTKFGIGGGSSISKQDSINQKSFDEIIKKIEGINVKALLSEIKNEKPLLKYQIGRFTAKNSRDYFIHKNLNKFLSEQLDYFIKSEVISIETLEQEKFLDKHITRAKVVREIGTDIINFLSQIEDFQKKLWEKKKFVLKTEYVISTDRIPEEFYANIFKSKEQKKEWKELGFETPKKSQELKDYFLPVDTKHFDTKFKEALLEKISENQNLDDFQNGLLIKSENFQGLNLLLNKYKEKIQTIYIDPPFNLGTNADFLYNVNYKDSTWASFLENRLNVSKILLDKNGCIFTRCDYNGNYILRELLNNVFSYNFINEIAVKRSTNLSSTDNKLPTGIDTIFIYSREKDITLNYVTTDRICKYCKQEKQPDWVPLEAPGDSGNTEIIINKIKFVARRNSHWTFTQELTSQLYNEKKVRINYDRTFLNRFGERINGLPEYLQFPYQKIDNNWTDIPGYSSLTGFQTENSEILLYRIILLNSKVGNIILDFFEGSGTSSSVSHKLGRKWISIELGKHFHNVIIPRIKKVLHFDSRGISSLKDVKTYYNKDKAGGFFKYQVLEQYEDVLDNLELKENKDALELFKNEYLLKYFLDFETTENNSLLNIEKLNCPFDYKIKVNFEEVGEPEETVIDIPETFNYLLGLKVNKFKSRFLNKNKYIFILGEKENKAIAVVWRNYNEQWKEKDYTEDKNFILNELKEWNPHVIYVNGQSILTNKFFEGTVDIKYIEPEFKKLMF